jgi:hypothetical protein
MFDLQGLAELIKLMIGSGFLFSRSEHAVVEIITIIGVDICDPDRSRPAQCRQEGLGGSRCLVRLGLDEESDNKEEITTCGFVRHLRQVFNINVQQPRFLAFERIVLAPDLGFSWQSRDLRVYEPPGDYQKIVQKHPELLAQGDDHGFLRRRQSVLQQVCHVRSPVTYRIASLQAADGVFRDTQFQRKGRCRPRRGLNVGPTGWGGRRISVQSDVHDAWLRSPSIRSRIASRTTKGVRRFASRQSFCTRHQDNELYAQCINLQGDFAAL